MLLATGLLHCGASPPEPIGVIESRLVSQNTFAAADWPGVETGSFVVRAWRAQSEEPPSLCDTSSLDSRGEWQCGLGALTGFFSVIDDRISDPGVGPLRIVVRIPNFGEEVQAYVSPIGHLIAEYALFLVESDGSTLTGALAEARRRFRPFLFEATEPHASPTERGLSTDAERQALLLEGMTRVAARHYSTISTFHRIRTISAALGVTLRQVGEFQDVILTSPTGDILVSREFLRHDWALELLEMAADLELSEAEAKRLAGRINDQAGPLFGFTRAPSLP